EAAQEANLAFDIGGRIIELTVDKSAEVEKGAVIARLDADDLENSVTEAQAELSRAESEYQRGLRLRERDAISVSAVESRRTRRDVAAATLATAKKRLEDATLRAPFAGYIADVPVEAFQTVAANQTVAVLQTTGVAAVVNMPADFVVFSPQFEPLDPVVILDALPGKELPAEFFEAAGVADEETQTYEASFIFKPSEDLLVLPGMTATIRTELQFQEETERFAQSGVSAPVSSIVSIGERLFVWVYDGATSTLSSRDVAIGEGVGGFVVVREGLQPGETIVAAGGAALDEGMVVRPWSTD
ncbi:MAG: efflux RND transporter periplasmic adaptor subunit, partial [Pseudomonadota bacterium]